MFSRSRSGGSLATQCFRTILSNGQRQHLRCLSKHSPSASTSDQSVDIRKLLATPSWSVASLFPRADQHSDSPEVTVKELHHLLRLSALPLPKDKEEEHEMLATLSSQLHFVTDIGKVDTTNIQPLRSLRDETRGGEKESELGMDALKDALDTEEIRGKHHRRIRRKRGPVEDREGDWNVMGSAAKRVGRYFVVEGGKDR